jgi:lipoprotein signal peptidase
VDCKEQRGDQLAVDDIGGAPEISSIRCSSAMSSTSLTCILARSGLYVFNVADAAISIGVVILLLRAFLIREKAPEGTNEHA